MDSPAIAPRRALLTGAARGLGREVAVQLAQRGCHMCIVDIDASGLSHTATAARSHGASVIEFAADLAHDGAAEAAVQTVTQAWSGIDVLINNAAISKVERFLDTSRHSWRTTFDVNVIAVAMASRSAAAAMCDQGNGRIINITSPSARMAIPEYVAYSASKAALDSMTRSLAAALGPFGILVNSLSPGMMDTEIQNDTEMTLLKIHGRTDIDAFREERTRRIPLGRRPSVAETAAMVVWLALDAPGYMTAERLNMSGGLEKD